MAKKKKATTTQPVESERSRLLRRHRIAKGLNTIDLGKLLDVSASAVSAWETGIRDPRPAVVAVKIRAFNT